MPAKIGLRGAPGTEEEGLPSAYRAGTPDDVGLFPWDADGIVADLDLPLQGGPSVQEMHNPFLEHPRFFKAGSLLTVLSTQKYRLPYHQTGYIILDTSVHPENLIRRILS